VVDPTSVNFMEQPIDAGPTEFATVTVTNRGVAELDLLGVSLSGDISDFAINVALGDSLPPGDSRFATFAFDPLSVGPKSATFEISSNDSSEPVVQVLLIGTGIEPATATPTETPSVTPTPSETSVISPTDTPTVTPTLTQEFSPTPSETPTEGPSQTPSETPTPGGPSDFDIHPDIPNGLINAGDLLRWFERLQGTGNDRSLLFDFARFWDQSVD
jgi:hypothetical protein